MPIFAIALVPEGNIVRTVREAVSLSLDRDDSPEASGLPEGIYLGFFCRPPEVRQDRQDSLTKEFRKAAESLFSGLPPLLRFSSCKCSGGRWYIVPDEALPRDMAMIAAAMAKKAGYSPLVKAPLLEAQGFFAGNNVTPRPFEAFSFRHLDAILYRIESPDDRFDKVWWRVLARVSRRTGPRRCSPRGSSVL